MLDVTEALKVNNYRLEHFSNIELDDISQSPFLSNDFFRNTYLFLLNTMQSNTTASHAQNEALKPKKLYLAGVGVTHSVGAPMHNTISQGLNLPWTFSNLECPTIQDVVTTFRRSDFAGGVITMPYKKGIIPHLDYLDDLVIQLGACNNVYLDKEGKLRGTNTDWRGVKGCLLAGSSEGRGRPALLVGAGGAARAAVYALFEHLDCITIYLINRDAKEVEDLKTDVQAYLGSGDKKINLVCVTSPAQVASLEPAYYIVGTVRTVLLCTVPQN